MRSTIGGALGTSSFAMTFHRQISPWHDVPLRPLISAGVGGGEVPPFVINFLCEIPKGTFAKMEIATKEPYNPIKQDMKKGALRYLKYNGQGIPFNYGAIPQTWEGPEMEPRFSLGYKGDEDPVDVVEISESAIGMGSVATVRILGALGLIDEGEMDWKILTSADANITTLAELERVRPGLISVIKEWFINYKTIDGKPSNLLSEDGKVFDEDYSLALVHSTHKHYQELVSKKVPNPSGLWIGEI